MQRFVIAMLAATVLLVTMQTSAWATVEGQTFIADVASLQLGHVKIELGFLADGVVGIDIPDAPDAVGSYVQIGGALTLVFCRFEDEAGTDGWFVAVAADPKQADPMSTDPATISGFGLTGAPDVFFFDGEELLTMMSSSSSSGRATRR